MSFYYLKSTPPHFFKLFSILLFAMAGSFATAEDKPELTVYTYDSFTSKWGPGPKVKEAFEKECNCTLNYVALEDGVSLLSRLKLEGENSKADVVLGLDTNLTAEAKASQLFVPHGIEPKPTTLPNDWSDEIFLPYDFGYFAFVYDKDKLKKPPKSMKELVENKNGPIILIQDPRTSTPGLGLLLWVKKIYGDKATEAWKQLLPRIVTVSKGWSEAYGLFLKGEAPMVLSYTTSPAYHIIAEKKDNYAAAKFEEGHYQQVEVAGMLANAKQPELAEQFLRFMQSETFQSIIPESNWMYPAYLSKEKLPKAFQTLIDPSPALLFTEEDVAKNRKAWTQEWLKAMAN